MKTYVVETDELDSVIEGYFKSLTEAKSFLKRNKFEKPMRILQIHGDYFGEGFHQYFMRSIDGKWVKDKAMHKLDYRG